MLKLLLDKLEKEWKVIKKIPIVFASLCALSLLAGTLICYGLFGSVLSLRSATIQAYKDRFGDLNSDQPKKLFQVLNYSKDPNSEKLIPLETNAPALAYPSGIGGSGAMFVWDIKTQSWR